VILIKKLLFSKVSSSIVKADFSLKFAAFVYVLNINSEGKG